MTDVPMRFSDVPLLWTVEDPVKLVLPASVFGGVFTCGLWCFAMIWVDRKFLPAPLRMKGLLYWLNWASGIALTGLGVMALWYVIPSYLSFISEFLFGASAGS